MNDFIDKNWKVMLVLVVGVIIAYGSVVFLGKNNPIEEDIEKVIKVETGLTIDLTP